MLNRLRLALIAGLALAASPRTASACAICFGGLDGKSGLANGFWWAIVLLLTITMSLLGGIGWAVWSIERSRAKTSA